MKYKKTIRRSVQDKTRHTRRMSQLHCWAVNRLKEVRENEKNPQFAERNRFLGSLTNWQRNQLMRRVGGELHKHSTDHLKVIVSTLKRSA